MKRALLWALVLALGVSALCFPDEQRATRTPFLLLGPFAELAAEVQWLRFHAASLAGDETRALQLAESALELAPTEGAGWQTLGAHLVFDLASKEREPDLARRRAYFQAGLAILRRGAEQSAHAQELEFFRALVLLGKAQSDAEVHPEGAVGLLREALTTCERAAALGHAQAAELVPQLRGALAAAE
ncbi:MAG: hypothetical protein EXS08_00510 [Planctomycetes bacterium]|nr:hypothetical protein [Planctomycetota bacterium]